MAIQALLITDDLFRNTDIPTRRKLAHLVKSVKDSGKLLVYFHQCTFQESRWQCIPASLQIFDFLCRTLNILRCNEQRLCFFGFKLYHLYLSSYSIRQMVNDLKIAPLFLDKLIILFLISSYFLQHLSGKYWDENPC
ncbi:hypothetical protein NC651_010805 [Populus alba x Populus x berolinensis]|nr:hypothetical protein NC651_010805 [Populus alba x Populus x berolinensis]